MFRLPVKVKVPVSGLYSSDTPVKPKGPLPPFPPTISTWPFWRVVAVKLVRGVLRLPVNLNFEGVPVIDAEPITDPTAAWIVAAPSATPVATPAVETVATVASDELQAALELMFPWLPSE